MESLRQWKPKQPRLVPDDVVCAVVLVVFVVVFTWGQYAS